MNYLIEDTIAALATAKGKSAIAVIRLSGKDAFQIIERIFKTTARNERQIKYGYIVDENQNIDEVLCAFFKSPNSYTGEDTVEISTHGNSVIIDEVLNILYKNGARAACPGEFSYRAFLNGKMDLAAAESVCAVISSKTQASARAALNNISGNLSKKIKNIKDSLTDLIAFMEANLDHPDEDIIFLSLNEKISRIDSIINEVKKLIASYKTSKVLQEGVKAAIVGKPNVGKSSILNAILGKNRAIVTDIAGTTTDTIEETINCRGIPATIIDTAGIRNKTKNPIEILGQEKTKETIEKSDILLWIFDLGEKITVDDWQISDFLKNLKKQIPIICVLNKNDLKSCIQKSDIENLAFFENIIRISAKTEEGISILLDEIVKIAGISESQNDYLMINSRHKTLLQNVLESLIKTKEILSAKDADEIACFEAGQAKSALNEILGIEIKEDILDAIFSKFCIGK
jgi:tRNA modification GTPase